ncbi:2-hydroxyacid dehydrogenase [Sphingorhabdus sp. Alg239-R122]|uniref:2-hydroxyacid dehydrogenase n=1 Tax=Sphingorhabdus sp. Alg239-R122 TaxID=2305989 RepID=UPI0013DA182D|nr:2-hydroxyacid dehydrogenase [Sphingorhabdus sp. Alg239-R122]
MTNPTKVLAMHPGMQGLFPNKPDHWEFVDTNGDVEKTIAEMGGDVEILLSASVEKLDKAMLDCFPNLKMIASISAGFNNVDLEECKAREIAVTNAPGLNSGDVADVAVTMLTSLLLRIPQNHYYIMSDQWVTKNGPIRHSMRGMPIGIVGLGSIGKEVFKRLEPFGMDIKWWGPRRKSEISIPYVSSLSELVKQSRGLIVCCRPDQSTHHLINREMLDQLGSDGVIVNVSRGTVVDERALIFALNSKRIGGAGLDVFDPEPTNSAKWVDVPNIILSPHQGGTTYETLFAQAQLAQNNIENFLDEKPLLSSVLDYDVLEEASR